MSSKRRVDPHAGASPVGGAQPGFKKFHRGPSASEVLPSARVVSPSARVVSPSARELSPSAREVFPSARVTADVANVFFFFLGVGWRRGSERYARRSCKSDVASTTPAQRARPMNRCCGIAARIPQSRASLGAAEAKVAAKQGDWRLHLMMRVREGREQCALFFFFFFLKAKKK